MKFKLYKTNGALNSPPVFSAFEQGLRNNGHTVVDSNEDISVIWSVLWQGRMQANRAVYENCIKNNKPVIIIEVGNLSRGTTWRISEHHIHGLGFFGNDENLDENRPEKLGFFLQPEKLERRDEILIASQHAHSLQWQGQPSMEAWIQRTVNHVRTFSDKNVVIRPHPRSQIRLNLPGVRIEVPKKIQGSYDDFDIDYNYHCVINHNSGPAVQAAIAGVPVICDTTSLAFPVSEKWENLENPKLLDRQEWFLKLCHTEWTVEEIAQGIPISRLRVHLESKL